MLKELISPDLILDNLEANNKEEVLKKISDYLISQGYVEEGYYEMIIEREKKYPTGLATEPFPVAIPHAEPIHVIKPCIIIARLKNPIVFTEMANNGEVSVKYIFGLVVQKSEEQIKILQSVIDIISNETIMKKIDISQTPQEMADILYQHIA